MLPAVRVWDEGERRRYPKGGQWQPTGPAPGRFAPRLGGTLPPPVPKVAQAVILGHGDGAPSVYIYDGALLHPAPQDSPPEPDAVHPHFASNVVWEDFGFATDAQALLALPGGDRRWRAVSQDEWDAMRRSGEIVPGARLWQADPTAALAQAQVVESGGVRPKVGGPYAYVLQVEKLANLRRVSLSALTAVVEARPVVEPILGADHGRAFVYRSLPRSSLAARQAPPQMSLPTLAELAHGRWRSLGPHGLSSFHKVATAGKRSWFVKQLEPWKAEAEAAASLVGRAMGAPVLPVLHTTVAALRDQGPLLGATARTALATMDEIGEGDSDLVITPWVEGKTAADAAVPDWLAGQLFRQPLTDALLFDYVVGSVDRHEGNYLYHYDDYGRPAGVVLIDHADAFFRSANLYTPGYAGALQPHWTVPGARLRQIVAAVRDLHGPLRELTVEMRGWWPFIEQRLARLEQWAGRDQVRMDELFPTLFTGRRPWPAVARQAPPRADLPSVDELAQGEWKRHVAYGATAHFFTVTDTGGRTGRTWFVKRPLWAGQTMADLELAAARLGQAVGAPVLPVRDVRKADLANAALSASARTVLQAEYFDDDDDHFLVMPFVEGELGGYMPLTVAQRAGSLRNDLINAALFDFVIANDDRHEANYFVWQNDQGEPAGITLIDHGYAFGEGQGLWVSYLGPESAAWTVSGTRLAELVAAGRRQEPWLRAMGDHGQRAWQTIAAKLDYLETFAGRESVTFAELFPGFYADLPARWARQVALKTARLARRADVASASGPAASSQRPTASGVAAPRQAPPRGLVVQLPYAPDPAYERKVEEQTPRYLAEEAAKLGIRPQALVDAVRWQVAGVIDHYPIAVAMDPKQALRVLADGRIKTQFETGQSNGTFDLAQRRKAERKLFGAPFDLDPTRRPVYGHFLHPRSQAATYYGAVQLVLKDDVRRRATFSVGDSFDVAHSDWLLPQPVGDSERRYAPEAWGDYVPELVALATQPERSWEQIGYFEAQIHGGVTLDDVAEIVIDDDAVDYFDVAGRYRKAVDRLEKRAARAGLSVRHTRPQAEIAAAEESAARQAAPPAPASDSALPTVADLGQAEWRKLSLFGTSAAFFEAVTPDGRRWFVKQETVWGDNDARAEEAAALVGRALGVDVLPVLRLQRRDLQTWAGPRSASADDAFSNLSASAIRGEELVITPWTEGVIGEYVDLDGWPLRRELTDDLLFDFIVGNSDRHGGNVLVQNAESAHPRLILIDHGYAFGGDDKLYTNVLTDLMDRTWTVRGKRLAEIIQTVRGLKDRLHAIAGTPLFETRWWPSIEARLARLERFVVQDEVPLGKLFPGKRFGNQAARQAAPPTDPNTESYADLPPGQARLWHEERLDAQRWGVRLADLQKLVEMPGFDSLLEIVHSHEQEVRLNVEMWSLATPERLGGHDKGTFEFSLCRDEDDGNLYVVLDHLDLPQDSRYHGLGTQMVGRLLALLQQRGYTSVELVANISIGTYAWAKMGFEMADEDLAYANYLFPHWARRHRLQPPSGGWPRFTSAYDLATYAVPGQQLLGSALANLDVPPAQRYDLGKAFLLDQGKDTLGEWVGVLDLRRELPAYLRAPAASTKAWTAAPSAACLAIRGWDEPVPEGSTDLPFWAVWLEDDA